MKDITEKPRVLAVVGPTATGKSALAVELALAFGGEVVSADSMQIYRGLDIGTAKPTIEERRGIPHHMIDIAQPGENFSVADYVARARACIDDIFSRGRLPIVAGGTGLFVKALLEGTRFGHQESDPDYRKSLNELVQREGPQALYEILAGTDPEMAAQVSPNNIKRVVRALEIIRATGEPASKRRETGWAGEDGLSALTIGLTCQSRASLYQRINERVDGMLRGGLLEEARRLYEMELSSDCTCMQAIGYKELFPYLSGDITLERAAELLKQGTRRYAKRQLTWFTRQHAPNWLFVDAEQDCNKLLEKSKIIMETKGMLC